MKSKKELLITVVCISLSFFLKAQVFTETFEGITGSGKPSVFNSSGQSFTAVTKTPGGSLGGFFGVYIPSNAWVMPNPGGGPTANGPGGFGVGTACTLGNCSGVSNKFLDNGLSSGRSQTYSVKTTNSSLFTIKSIYLFFSSDNGNNNNAPGSVIISGKKAGTVMFSITKTTGFVTGFSTNNGFNFIDFSTEGGSNNSNKGIDEIEFKCDATVNYFAIDNFTWGFSSASLPLQLLDFAGTMYGNNISLFWRTEAEVNVSHFELQWCKDASSWHTINTQLAKGKQSRDSNSYNYIHSNATGLNFYRLKMVDIDGKFTISKVVKFTGVANENIGVYPNPAKNILMINQPGGRSAKVQLVNSVGMIIKTIQLSNPTSLIDISGLIPGVYLIQINQGEFVKSQFFVKQ